MIQQLAGLYRRYPTRINGAIASVLVSLGLLIFDVSLDHDTIVKLLAIVGPLVVAEVTHHKVTPAK